MIYVKQRKFIISIMIHSTTTIKSKFINFFLTKKYHLVSDQNVKSIDKSVVFIGAGMMPIKDFFLGKKESNYDKLTSSQTCIRTQDFINIIRTERHLTSFNMLGFFSINKMNKWRSIEDIWDFLTKILCIDKDRLYVTVHPKDTDTYNVWINNINLPKHKVKFDDNNIWYYGNIGPFGRCTEIFFIRSEDDTIDDLEICNIVFIDSLKTSSNTTIKLHHPHVDCGLGLEWLAMVLQSKNSIFDIDSIWPYCKIIDDVIKPNIWSKNNRYYLIKKIFNLLNTIYTLIKHDVNYYDKWEGFILKQMIKTLCFQECIIVNKKDAYKWSFNLLIEEFFRRKYIDDMHDSWIYKYKKDHNYILKKMFIYIKDIWWFINDNIKHEQSLIMTLIKLKENDHTLNELHKVLFYFFNTYGISIKWISDICQELNIYYDVNLFISFKKKHRSISKAKIDKKYKNIFLSNIKNNLELVRDSTFIYDCYRIKSYIVYKTYYIQKKKMFFTLEKTIFFSEWGGQDQDHGFIIFYINNHYLKGKFHIIDAIKYKGKFLYSISMNAFQYQLLHRYKGIKIELIVDQNIRRLTMKNHTATHILVSLINKRFGSCSKQVSSYLNHEYLRLGMYLEKNTPLQKDLGRLKIILENDFLNVINQCIPITCSIKKNTKNVWLNLNIDKETSLWTIHIKGVSEEFCCGTHIENTSKINAISITSIKFNVNTNVLLIKAITSNYLLHRLRMYQEVARKLWINIFHIHTHIESMQNKLKISKEHIIRLEKTLLYTCLASQNLSHIKFNDDTYYYLWLTSIFTCNIITLLIKYNQQELYSIQPTIIEYESFLYIILPKNDVYMWPKDNIMYNQQRIYFQKIITTQYIKIIIFNKRLMIK